MNPVLVVDDDPDFRHLIEDILGEHGFDAVTAKDGREALAHVASRRFSAIVLDIVLPGMSGVEVMQRLPSPRPPILFVTSDASLVPQGAEHLLKPVALDRLLAFVRKHAGSSTVRAD